MVYELIFWWIVLWGPVLGLLLYGGLFLGIVRTLTEAELPPEDTQQVGCLGITLHVILGPVWWTLLFTYLIFFDKE